MAKAEKKTIATIEEQIRQKTFSNLYLFYGEEEYLKRQYKQKLIRNLVSEGDTMNFSSYEGKGLNQREIIDLAETLPFFADRRVILIENSECCKNTAEDLTDYVKSMAEDHATVLIFVENEVDKRNRLYKALNEKGCCVEFERQNERVLMQWILTKLKRENKKITQAVMQLFLEKTGDDMERIEKELEKLICYTYGREVIEAEDVETICVEQISNKIFEMVNEVAKKNQKRALELYYDLLALKEPPMRILFLLTRQFHILFLVKNCVVCGKGQSEIASICKIPPFAVRNHQAQAKSFTQEELKRAVEDGVSAEEDVKTGKMNDQLAVELFLIKYSTKKTSA